MSKPALLFAALAVLECRSSSPAPHHRADNAGSLECLRAVSPQWIAFSAGHDHEHLRRPTAERCLGLGLAADHLLPLPRQGQLTARYQL